MRIEGQSARTAVTGNTPPCRITIVDDDASIREALKSLMRSVQIDVDAFASAEEFLASERVDDTECLILDVLLPGMTGFELQSHLNTEQRDIPIVFITANSDDASRQRALNAVIPYASISRLDVSPSSFSTATSTGSPWQSQPARRGT